MVTKPTRSSDINTIKSKLADQEEIVQESLNTFFKLTDTKIDADTARALGLSLSFIPKPRTKENLITMIEYELYRTTRSLRLADSFKDKEDPVGEKPHIRIDKPDYQESKANQQIEDFIKHLTTGSN